MPQGISDERRRVGCEGDVSRRISGCKFGWALTCGVGAVPQWFVLSMAGLITGTFCFLPFSPSAVHITFIALSFGAGVVLALLSWLLRSRRRGLSRDEGRHCECMRDATCYENEHRRHCVRSVRDGECDCAQVGQQSSACCFFQSRSWWCVEIVPAVELILLGTLVLLEPQVVLRGQGDSPANVSDNRDSNAEPDYPMEAVVKVFLLHLWFVFAVNMSCASSLAVNLVHFGLLMTQFNRLSVTTILLSTVPLISSSVLTAVIAIRMYLLRRSRQPTHLLGEGSPNASDGLQKSTDSNRTSGGTTAFSTGLTEAAQSRSVAAATELSHQCHCPEPRSIGHSETSLRSACGVKGLLVQRQGCGRLESTGDVRQRHISQLASRGQQYSWKTYGGLLDEHRSPCLIVDQNDNCIVFVGVGFVELTGMNADELVGKKIGSVLDELQVESAATILDVLYTVGSVSVPQSPSDLVSREVGGGCQGQQKVVNVRGPNVRTTSSKQQSKGPKTNVNDESCDFSTEVELESVNLGKGGGHRVLLRGCRRHTHGPPGHKKDLSMKESKFCVGRKTGQLCSEKTDHVLKCSSMRETAVNSKCCFSFSLDVYAGRRPDTFEKYIILCQPLLHHALDCIPLPCFLVHPRNGCVLHWSREAQRVTGLSAYCMVGWPVCFSPAGTGVASSRRFADEKRWLQSLHVNMPSSATIHTPWAKHPFVVTLHSVANDIHKAEGEVLASGVSGLFWPGRHLTVSERSMDSSGVSGSTSDDGRVNVECHIDPQGGNRLSILTANEGCDKRSCTPLRPPKDSRCTTLSPLSPAELIDAPSRDEVDEASLDATSVPLLFVIQDESYQMRQTALSEGFSSEPHRQQQVEQQGKRAEVEEFSHTLVSLLEEFRKSVDRVLGMDVKPRLEPPRAGANLCRGIDAPEYIDEIKLLLNSITQILNSSERTDGTSDGEFSGGKGTLEAEAKCGQTLFSDDASVSVCVLAGGTLNGGDRCTAESKKWEGSSFRENELGDASKVPPLVSTTTGPHKTCYDKGEPNSLGLSSLRLRHRNPMYEVQGCADVAASDAVPLRRGSGSRSGEIGLRQLKHNELLQRMRRKPCDMPLAPSHSVVEVSSRSGTPPSSVFPEANKDHGELPVWAVLRSNDEATVPSFCIRVPLGEVFRFGRSSKCHATISDSFVSGTQFTITRWVPAESCTVLANAAASSGNVSPYGSRSPTPSTKGAAAPAPTVEWRVELRDNSINGTYVNVKRVGKGKTCVLRNNDLITFQLSTSRFFMGFKFLLTDECGTPISDINSSAFPPTSGNMTSCVSGRASPHFFQRTSSEVGSAFALSSTRLGSFVPDCAGSGSCTLRSCGGSVSVDRRCATPTTTANSRSRRRGGWRHHRGTIEWKIGEEMLGKGGNAEVFLGMNLTNGKLIAVKRVPLPREAGGNGSNENVLQKYMSLQEEIKVLSKAVHPNIVQYYGSSQNKDYFNILLEFVPGGSLRHLLENFGVLSPGVICSYLRQTLEGLRYLHQNNIVHSDVKAANILVTDKGRVKLSDFGTAKHLNWQRGQLTDPAAVVENAERPDGDADAGGLAHRVAGTLRWMAPELVRECSGPTRASDIWSVGCALIEMLSGDAPWSEYEFESEEEIVNLLKYTTEPPEVPDCQALPELSHIARKCLSLSPDGRPTCEELLHLVEEAKAKLEPQEDETLSQNDDSASLPHSSARGDTAQSRA